jgi:IclR family transcriptional regulator, acetate operon repressor
MGRGVVLHATATGKAWLATFPIEEALARVKARGLDVPERFGPNVVRSIAALRRELELTRRQGYGIAVEEGEPGTAAIAAVVRASGTPSASVVGTVSIAGPVARLTPERRERFAEYVLAAARELSTLWPARDLSSRMSLAAWAAE